jgi:hypothetical protein
MEEAVVVENAITRLGNREVEWSFGERDATQSDAKKEQFIGSSRETDLIASAAK